MTTPQHHNITPQHHTTYTEVMGLEGAQELPVEVWVCVLKWLPWGITDLCSCALVSTTLYHAACDNSLWRPLLGTYRPHPHTASLPCKTVYMAWLREAIHTFHTSPHPKLPVVPNRLTGGTCPMVRTIMLGDSSVGKTSLLHRYADGAFNDALHWSSIGIDFKLKYITRGDGPIKLQLWDTAGQEKYRTSCSSAYFSRTRGCMLVYDVTSEASLNKTHHWFEQIQRHSMDGMPTVLVGNKCDLVREWQVTYEQGLAVAKMYKCPFVETSALSDTNVTEAFEMLVDSILSSLSWAGDSKGIAFVPPEAQVEALLCAKYSPPPTPTQKSHGLAAFIAAGTVIMVVLAVLASLYKP
eukprot:TRINITY_DN5034_c1_g1_i1.p1 TRINITY_DN5034_c1_g1~~TRINITY_DN5034_c1_g1_i1.p1  ORF type:complete len:360 (+),score=36.26 TRINITY_DN5034_c1_g1_i1:23-1081(+)